jgi:DNA repair exonuclease SbcCD nuclease subunit
MSRVFLIGDTHIGLGFPNKSEDWFKIHKQYFSDFLIPLLKSEVEDGDIIVHLGDLFDNRNVIPINLLNFGLEIVEQLAAIAPLHIILGNHDCWHKSSSEINTIRPFKWIPNVTIWEKTGILEFCGKKLLMMPYIEKKSEQIKNIIDNKNADYLFCHSDLNGAKMHLTSVAHKNPDKIDVEEFSTFKGVYSGHIHILDRHKNFTFVGNIFQMDRNDFGNQKGIFALDMETGEEFFWKNMVSPVYEKVYITSESDLSKLESVDMNNWIDLFISNKLLVSNRKLRRKLEATLQNGSFASINYLDDIEDEAITEKKEAEEQLDIQDLPQFQLEFKQLIEDYINGLKYDDKVKKGILSEYHEVIRIFEDTSS